MADYYAEKLSAGRLRRCYELAPPRVRRYLAAEIDQVRSHCGPRTRLLELGCGYGPVLAELTQDCAEVIGVDTSFSSLREAKRFLGSFQNVGLVQQDAARLAFTNAAFDVVCCVQNGVSAFKRPPRALFAEALRVVAPGGVCLFSTYTPEFWPERLEWFRRQSGAGLLGPIDEERTGDGVIVCRDGFRAVPPSAAELLRHAAGLNGAVKTLTVDDSSLFIELRSDSNSIAGSAEL
jgi:SAM-dependent methyltransferase